MQSPEEDIKYMTKMNLMLKEEEHGLQESNEAKDKTNKNSMFSGLDNANGIASATLDPQFVKMVTT